MFFGRTDAEAETPVLWPPHAKNWLIGKNSDAGRDWRQEEKGTTEDEMAGWHHRLDGREFEWILEVGDGQGGLACCNSWGRKESDMTEWLNWTDWTNSWKDAQHRLLLEKCKSKPQWDITAYWSEWPSSKSLQTINAGEGLKKRERSCTVGGSVNWYSHYGRQYGDSFKN